MPKLRCNVRLNAVLNVKPSSRVRVVQGPFKVQWVEIVVVSWLVGLVLQVNRPHRCVLPLGSHNLVDNLIQLLVVWVYKRYFLNLAWRLVYLLEAINLVEFLNLLEAINIVEAINLVEALNLVEVEDNLTEEHFTNMDFRHPNHMWAKR